MKKKTLLLLSLSACVILACGCSKNEAVSDQTSTAETTEADLSSADSAAAETEQTNDYIIALETTTEPVFEITETETLPEESPSESDSSADAEESASESDASLFETDENGNLIIDINTTNSDDTTSSNGRMNTKEQVYSKGRIRITYPEITGMSDSVTQSWANALLKKDALSLISLYEISEDTDMMEVTFDVATLYRSEISVVYSGNYKKKDSEDTIYFKAADTLNLNEQKQLRLCDRISQKKLVSSILTSPDYKVLSTSISEDTLRQYISNMKEEELTSLLSTADFGSDHVQGFSYTGTNSVVIILPLPHTLGDYAELSIVQQTK